MNPLTGLRTWKIALTPEVYNLPIPNLSCIYFNAGPSSICKPIEKVKTIVVSCIKPPPNPNIKEPSASENPENQS